VKAQNIMNLLRTQLSPASSQSHPSTAKAVFNI